MQRNSTSISDIPLTSLFMVGTEVFGEVQRLIGSSRIRALKIKLGKRTIKEIPLAPLTAVTTVLLAVLAVVISNISVEVEHESATLSANEALS
jgi:hypothetical protein